MKTIIVGRGSNLSRELLSILPDSVLISAREWLHQPLFGNHSPLKDSDQPFQVIINSFQPATHLHDVSNPEQYVGLSLGITAKVLASLPKGQCRKLVYTSSASVYGDSLICREDDTPKASDLHSALKLANECLIRRYCGDNELDFTIARVFNMYGGSDSFSIVSKILSASRTGSTLSISNGGNAVRDFIHVNDVISVYQSLLLARDVPIVNVGSGVGVSIRTIIDAIRIRDHDIKTITVDRNEIRMSAADTTLLRTLADVEQFTHVVDYAVSNLDEPGKG